MKSHYFSSHRNISLIVSSNWVSAGIGKEGAEKRSITLCPMLLCPSLHGTFQHLGFSLVPWYILALGDLAVYQKALQLCNCIRSKMQSVISVSFIFHLTLTLHDYFPLRKPKFSHSYSPHKCNSETWGEYRCEGTKFPCYVRHFLPFPLLWHNTVIFCASSYINISYDENI